MTASFKAPFRKTRKYLGKKIRICYQESCTLLRPARYSNKIFCIGYNKTGTTSVGKSLAMLGFRNTSFNKRVWRKYYSNNQIDKILSYATKFDSFDDLPWLKEDMIPILDQEFPQSKFIYLTRDDEAWKKSFYHWRYKVFGTYPDMEKAYQEYCQHREFVLDYFQNRSKEDFLVLNVKDPLGFKKLAEFLGKDTDREEFPHYNKT